MKIDLDDLRHDATGAPAGRCPSEHAMCMPPHGCAATRLALIERIRELENAVRALAVGSLVGEITADHAKAILERGAVLP